jgi:C-terminal processing protease CtpA/Prc
MNAINKLILFLLAAITLNSCRLHDDSEDIIGADSTAAAIIAVNNAIYDLMKDVYLWNNYLPTVTPSTYPTPDSLMEALMYSVYDKWSRVMRETEYAAYFEEGTMLGYGFGFGPDEAENIRISFLYRNTQTYNMGVKRGWIISKVNGSYANMDNIRELLGEPTVGLTNDITFLDENGDTVNLSLSKQIIKITPIVHYEVLNQGDSKIGYMVFQDFITAAYAELEEAFTYFANQSIDELIVDLRYNGGGSVFVADTLAGLLIGDNFADQPFVNLRYNRYYARYWNKTYDIPDIKSGLNLSRVFFIGTEYTASASELVINGLKPYTQAILAGSKTHGKPVGMNTWKIKNYVVLPVTFKYTNANNEGDFYDGLEPALPAGDDLTKDFGDPEEASLKAVLKYIETGAVPVKSTKSTGYRAIIMEPKGPLGQYLKAY